MSTTKSLLNLNDQKWLPEEDFKSLIDFLLEATKTLEKTANDTLIGRNSAMFGREIIEKLTILCEDGGREV